MTTVKPLALVSCPDCRHLNGTRCNNFAAAELSGPSLSRWLIERQQRCPGFTARAPPPAPARPPPDRPHPPQTEPETEIETDMILTENQTTTYSPTPEGTHPARCCALVDLGTSETVYEGKARTRRRVRITFEIADSELITASGERFQISRTFTASLSEKGALRPFLESWRGRSFTAQELAGFDLKSVLEAPGLIAVVHETKGDRTYANAKTVSKLPKGMSVEQLTTAPIFWDMTGEPDWTAWERLSDRAKDEISETPEFKKLARPADTAAPAGDTDPDSDDIPF